VEVSEEEALEDDILLVIDLPIAADEARDAGLEQAEIVEALDAADTAAVSPATMTEVLDDEAEQNPRWRQEEGLRSVGQDADRRGASTARSSPPRSRSARTSSRR